MLSAQLDPQALKVFKACPQRLLDQQGPPGQLAPQVRKVSLECKVLPVPRVLPVQQALLAQLALLALLACKALLVSA